MATRSKPLWWSVVAAAQLSEPRAVQSLVFSPNAGEVAIVKTIAVQSQSGTGGSLTAVLSRPSTGASVTLFNEAATAYGFVVWQGWVVMDPGDQMYIIAENAPAHTAGFGAILPPRPIDGFPLDLGRHH